MTRSSKTRTAAATVLVAAVVAVVAGCSTPPAPPASSAGPPASAPASSAARNDPAPFPATPPRAAVIPPVRSAALADAFAADTPAPVRLEIHSQGIDVPVVASGIKDDGGMSIPENPAEAGWYRFGPAPADSAGSTVIAAHVDSLRYGLGPFVALRDLPAGDLVVVTDAADQPREYAVESVTYYPKTELPVAQLFERSGSPRLVLITCGGAFDEESRTYADNVVVVAVPR